MLIQSATPPATISQPGSHSPHKGSKSSKHGLCFCHPKPPGGPSGQNQRPCLSELLPHQPHAAHPLNLDSREMAHHNQSTRAETMLRTCTAQRGKPAATLSHNTTMAANLISMVFQIPHPKLKCRWFFGRAFSFPLLGTITTGKETGPRAGYLWANSRSSNDNKQ